MKPQLGFGIMRFQNEKGEINYAKVKSAIDEYMKGEICYFDLHPGYVNGLAQTILREYVVKKYSRESFKVANKIPYYGVSKCSDYLDILNKELQECGVKYFDRYMLHAITKDVYMMHKRLGGFDFLKWVKSEGKALEIGISFHDSPQLLEKILKEYQFLDFVQLQINFYDWENSTIRAKECYEIARKYKKKIVVMEPIKGGSLAKHTKNNEMSQTKMVRLCLEFVASLEGIDIILSGMTNADQVKENRNTLNQKTYIIKDEDYKILKKIYEEQNTIACTDCGYCKKGCPQNIKIPEIINLLNASMNVGEDETTSVGWQRIFYRGYIANDEMAGKCIGCRKCEKYCPQKLEIHKYMKQAKELLENNYNAGTGYTDERNAQIVIALLKAHGVRKIVASPGMTNVCLVASLQTDPFFDIYSAPDERSGAYIACGLAAESGETVVLSCTGATSSRNYYPGLTEAYYSKLPILVITSSRRSDRIGHNFDQVTDRTAPTKDVVKLSVQVPFVRDGEDAWACEIAVNKAILETTRHGCGPVHMNLETMYSPIMNTVILPPARVIKRVTINDDFPTIDYKRVAIIVGAHLKWSDKLTGVVDKFCEKYNAAVLCDHTSNYKGKYKVFPNIMSIQRNNNFDYKKADLIISIGNISSSEYGMKAKESWRVNPDGEIRDTFWNLTKVFEMSEEDFFEHYISIISDVVEMEYYETCSKEENKLINQLDELPFSNLWVASQTANRIPNGSIVHLGIRNSLRSWNYFSVSDDIQFYANTGGFGIDGSLSTVLGNSLASEKLCFCVLGDLAFFYDMNAMGNRHVNPKLRILLINNGTGMEMQFTDFLADKVGADKDSYIAASGHYGNKSQTLVRDYATNLGFSYLTASNKTEYLDKLDRFCSIDESKQPIIFEVFVEKTDEDEAYSIIEKLNGELPEIADKDLINPSERLANQNNQNIVIFGTGALFRANINNAKLKSNIKYACDNNPDKWGTEVAPGIICLSPEELSKMPDPFVLIALVDSSASMSVANQLIDMGIKKFDHILNWLRYKENS